jgi:porin
VNFFLDSGIVVSNMIPSRPDDKFGASFIYANISDQARAFDRDTIAFSGTEQPVRDYEITVELSYQAQIKPGWTLQPSFQYIFHPGGHAPDATNPKRPIRNGAVFGLRTTIAY